MTRDHRLRMIQLFMLLLLGIGLALPAVSHAFDYAIGADLSFLKHAEDRGTAFQDEGQAKPGLEIL